VAASVPDDVDEAGQALVVAGGDPAQAEPLHLVTPVPVEEIVLEPLCMKDVELIARERAAPLVRDGHYARGRVTAPSLALETCAAYLAKTPVV
jgi:hypothetical protein